MLPMNPLKKVSARRRPPTDPESEAEAERIRLERETIRTSQLTGPPNVALDARRPRFTQPPLDGAPETFDQPQAAASADRQPA